MIQRGLQNFDKIIDTLPLEDQKELLQLLIREIRVYPFDPKKEESSKPERDAFITKIRTKWLKVKMQLYAIPDISIDYKKTLESSYSKNIGCPVWIPPLS